MKSRTNIAEFSGPTLMRVMLLLIGVVQDVAHMVALNLKQKKKWAGQGLRGIELRLRLQFHFLNFIRHVRYISPA